MSNGELKYISNEQIDAERWNRCIAGSPNETVYAYSWFLDHICDNWDALILGDYQYVMPIVPSQKYGISYIYQPLYTQQMGVFPTPTNEVLNLFLDQLKSRFKFAAINVNAFNLPLKRKDIIFENRHNFLLDLSKTKEQIESAYSTNTKRNLKKAEKNKLSFLKGISVEEFLQLKRANQKIKIPEVAYNRIKQLISFSRMNGKGELYGVYNSYNELCAAVFMIASQKRVIYLNATSNEEGKNLGANHFLLDRFISENCGKNLLLDFEGSMIPGVARFYKGFGASAETYYHVSWNNLPWWIKWLKK